MELESFENNFSSANSKKNKDSLLLLKNPSKISIQMPKFLRISFIVCSIIMFILFIKIIIVKLDKTIFISKNLLFETIIDDSQIRKPLTDSRKYEIVKFSNGIESVFIHDPEATRSGVSLSVNIEGNYSRAAVFAQKVLISNTGVGQEFERSVKKYFGNYKLTTEEGISNYYYDVENEGLNETLHWLIRTIFRSNILNQDISGNQKYYMEMDLRVLKHFYEQINTDTLNIFSVELADKVAHNISQASTSSSFDEIMELLRTSYFIPENIKFSIISNYSFNEMITIFNDNIKQAKFIPKNKDVENNWYANPGKLGKIITYESIRKKNVYNYVTKCISDTNGASLSYYEYLAYIVNDFKNLSLFGQLDSLDYVKNLTAEVVKLSISSPNYFIIAIELTDEGLYHLGQISSSVFAFFEQFATYSNYKDTYEDLKTIYLQKFKFLTISKYHKYLNKISSGLFEKSYRDILFSSYNIPDFTSFEINKIISNAKYFENVAIIIETNKKIELFDSDKKPHLVYNDIFFIIEDINEDAMKDLIEEKKNDVKYYFKNKNEYISSTNYLETVDGTKEERENEINKYIPKNKLNRANVEFYYRLDRTFKVPRIQSYFLFDFFNQKLIEKYYDDANLLYIDDVQILFFNRIKQKIKFSFNEAFICGNYIDLVFLRNQGFLILIDAYPDMTFRIFRELMYLLMTSYTGRSLVESDFDDITYNDKEEKVIDLIANVHHNQKQIKPMIDIEDMSIYNKNIISDYHTYFVSHFNLIALTYGVVKEEFLKNMSEFMLQYMRRSEENDHTLTRIKIKSLNEFFVNQCIIYRYPFPFWTDNLNYLINIIIIGPRTIKNEIMTDILISIYRSKSFKKTQIDKIYYLDTIFIKVTKTSELNDHLSSPDVLGNHSMNEIGSLFSEIQNIKAEDFERIKQTLIKQKKRKDLTLKSKADKAWNMIFERSEYKEDDYNYEKEVNSIDKLIFNVFAQEKLGSHLFLSFQFYANSNAKIDYDSYTNYTLRDLNCLVYSSNN